MRTVVLLSGPTAVGKTAVACALQDRLGGVTRAQLISADSTLVYCGLDIGTAKPSRAELERYPHELINIRDPAQVYSVADFVADADRCVQQAWARGQVPILVGGTMLYLKRFVEGIAPLPSAEPAIRAQLEEDLKAFGGQVLHAQLSAVDATAAAMIHPNNSQRLLRALEVIAVTGQPLSHWWQNHPGKSAAERLGATLKQYAIVPDDRARLHARISSRFDSMLDAGFVEEVRALYERGDLQPDLPALRAVGYRQAWQYIQQESSYNEFCERAVAATRQLAKRQLTWTRQWEGLNTLNWGTAADLAQRISL